MARIKLDLDLDAADAVVLRGVLLAAKATELAEVHRRGNRLSFGYGSDSAREGMTAEIAHARRRIELLDDLLAALDRAAGTVRPTTRSGRS
jgi:hypothetical protein